MLLTSYTRCPRYLPSLTIRRRTHLIYIQKAAVEKAAVEKAEVEEALLAEAMRASLDDSSSKPKATDAAGVGSISKRLFFCLLNVALIYHGPTMLVEHRQK